MKTVEQMALLNCLMYYKIKFPINTTLGDAITDLQLDEKNWFKRLFIHPGFMSMEKTKAVMNAIMQDEELRNMRIVANTEEYAKVKGPVSVCLVDEKNKEAVFCFRGTNSAEWLDNGEGFMQESSTLQREALKFFEKTVEKKKLIEKGYSIDVTGHSKGGNKAQYITIKHPAVRDCYSFEGQGFSKEFVEENSKKIAERRHKIATYAADKDYVNPLGIDIARWHKFYKTTGVVDGNLRKAVAGLLGVAGGTGLSLVVPVIEAAVTKIADRLASHSPGAYIHFEDGRVKMNEETEQSPLSKKIHEMTVDMMGEEKEKRHSYFIGLMSMLQASHKCEPVMGDIPIPKARELVQCMKDVLSYFASRKADDNMIDELTACARATMPDTWEVNMDPRVAKKPSNYLSYRIEVDKQEEGEYIGTARVLVNRCVKLDDIRIKRDQDELKVEYPCFEESGERKRTFRPTNMGFALELEENILEAYEKGSLEMVSGKKLNVLATVEKDRKAGYFGKLDLNKCLMIEKIYLKEEKEGVKLIFPTRVERAKEGIKEKPMIGIGTDVMGRISKCFAGELEEAREASRRKMQSVGYER